MWRFFRFFPVSTHCAAMRFSHCGLTLHDHRFFDRSYNLFRVIDQLKDIEIRW